MSHTQHDRSGGYVGRFIDVGEVSSNTPGFRRFAKRFHRREARRECRKIVAAAMVDMDDEIAEAQRELMLLEEDLFYGMEDEYDDWLSDLDQPDEDYDPGPDDGWAYDWDDLYY